MFRNRARLRQLSSPLPGLCHSLDTPGRFPWFTLLLCLSVRRAQRTARSRNIPIVGVSGDISRRHRLNRAKDSVNSQKKAFASLRHRQPLLAGWRTRSGKSIFPSRCSRLGEEHLP